MSLSIKHRNQSLVDESFDSEDHSPVILPGLQVYFLMAENDIILSPMSCEVFFFGGAF